MRKMLMATAAIALIAGTSGALAQQKPQRGAPAEKVAPKAPGGGMNSGAPARPGAAQNGGAIHTGAAEERGEPLNRAEAQPNRGRSEITGRRSLSGFLDRIGEGPPLGPQSVAARWRRTAGRKILGLVEFNHVLTRAARPPGIAEGKCLCSR